MINDKKTNWKVVSIVFMTLFFVLLLGNILVFTWSFKSIDLEDQCIDICTVDDAATGYDYDILTTECSCLNPENVVVLQQKMKQ